MKFVRVVEVDQQAGDDCCYDIDVKPTEPTKADKAAAELFEIYTAQGEKVCQTRFAEMQAGLKHFEAMILREKFYWLLKKAGKV